MPERAFLGFNLSVLLSYHKFWHLLALQAAASFAEVVNGTSSARWQVPCLRCAIEDSLTCCFICLLFIMHCTRWA